MTGQKKILDWRHATTGPMAPCVICGTKSILRSPGKKVPCHKTCAENWLTAHRDGRPQQAQLAA